MTNTMVNENSVTFKDIEENIYKEACRVCRETTVRLLENIDKKLMQERNKKEYRNKGTRKTTIKTMYGEVEYRRTVYETCGEDGLKKFVFLMDEALMIDGVGLISQNMAEQMVSGITELSYRGCAKKITEMTGQTISAMGVWNVVQSLGEEVCKEEKQLVEAHKKGRLTGKKEAPVLFEEADGIYINFQGDSRKFRHSGELKVGIAYDGWKETGTNRYELDGKVVVAGFANTKEFHEYREAAIAAEYNLDETQIRILNGDGAPWIKKVKDKETHFQLDIFHRNKAIKECIPYRHIRAGVHKYLDEKNIDGLLTYLEAYRNMLCDDNEIELAEKILKYFTNNKQGLLPYLARGLELPECPSGLIYKNLGTMENHMWSVIAKRMKHNHTCWSRSGANNLAKILAKKCSGKLYEITQRMSHKVFSEDVLEDVKMDTLSSAKVRTKNGKGYNYPVSGHIVGLDTALRGARKKLLSVAGF